jgi:uncharacterized membrane protein
MRLAMSGAGVIMATYLVYIELFRVDAICLWCTGVHLTAIALFTTTLVARTTVPSGWGAIADRRLR